MKISPERIRQIIKEEVGDAHREEQESSHVQSKLNKIADLADEIAPLFSEATADKTPPWIQEKVEIIAALLQAILSFKNGEDPR